MKTKSEIERRVERVAKRYGWEMRLESSASTGTRYYNMWRALPEVDDDPDDPTDWSDADSFILRVGDHGTAHCSEDFSLVVSGHEGGDDSSWDAVEKRLAKHGTLSRLQKAILDLGCRECAEHAVAKTRRRYRGESGVEPQRCGTCQRFVLDGAK